jgi:hypothetical protein
LPTLLRVDIIFQPKEIAYARALENPRLNPWLDGSGMGIALIHVFLHARIEDAMRLEDEINGTPPRHGNL